MSDLFDDVSSLQSITQAKPAYFGSIVNFSNTRNNWFAISIDDLIDLISDIIHRRGKFVKAGVQYDETLWRDVVNDYVTSDTTRALFGTQTLPLFQLLAKIIHVCNPSAEYADKRINLNLDALEATRSQLIKYVSTHSGTSHPTAPTGSNPIIGENRLYYGAPGTGKSYQIAQDTKGHETVRTVFHPDTQNSDFIGTLKPVNDNGTLSYRFSPGPFSRALVKAIQKPNEHIYLIIEELNRAPAAAVFGELFLLLDREPDGRSSYDIDFPSDEFKKWFNTETSQTNEKLSLPANLSILASMNSADQGVFPLDTAFRRRWLSTYMPVTASEAPEGKITVRDDKTQTSYEWKVFLEHLNNYLIEKLHVEEDRLIGQRFMTEYELQDGSISGKLLIYLWDDLLRHGQREALFCPAHKTYGSLHRANDKPELIFSEEFLQSLSSVPSIAGT